MQERRNGTGGSGIDAKGKNNPNASGQPASPCHAWGLPPRVVEDPASPGLLNRGSPGRRKPSGWPVHTKTGVTAARLPPERTEPGNRFLAPPARGDEAEAQKEAATSGCYS